MLCTNIESTEKFACKIRLLTVKQLKHRGFGHIGGCLSIADALAVLYNDVMNYDPANPNDPTRDYLVVSKGHAGPAVYSTLALKGFFPEDWLYTLNIPGTRLPSHCDASKTPGIDFTTGSLGQGLSAGVGLSYAFRLDKKPNYVYVILGDGECQEGQVWEAAMSAVKFRLDHLVCFVDSNKIQIDGTLDEIMPLEDLSEKFRSFGWHVQRINGHDAASILSAVTIAHTVEGKPCVIILDTVKGKGVSEIEALGNLCHHMEVSTELGEEGIRQLNAKLLQYRQD